MRTATPASDRNRCGSSRVTALLLAIAATVPGYDAHAAAEACPAPMARVVSAQGGVEVLRARDTRWQPAPLGTALCHGDTVRVLERGRAALALNNEVVVRLDHRSTMSFTGPAQDSPSLMELCRGALHFITRFPKPLRVITPFMNASVEGTEFSVTDRDGQREVAVMEGRVSAVNSPERTMPRMCEQIPDAARMAGGGLALLTAGQTVSVVPGQVPRPTLLARPADAVQWALYYPPLVDYRVEPGAAAWQTAWSQSSRAYREGRLADALATAGGAADEANDARFYVWRAGLLLQVGRADEAERDIQHALRLRGADADAQALQAIVAVVRNEKDRALKLAGDAVRLQPGAAAAHIAMSYVLQAQFRIDEALKSAHRATAIDAGSGIAWARVAELEMSTGRLEAALAAAERAAASSPQLSRTHTILGFAHLTRMNTAAAKDAFAAAIERDSADPLPRLGIGLARIRDGELEAGRKEIEIAAVLDPGNALVRSYLGKAYFEEKREKLAVTQFDLAKALDPRDPTPWFYDAIQKQIQNRPVEALGGLQRSTELNDNRAVSRSRLLLDQDAAARGVNTARVYNDLGFEQLALVEGYRSTNVDPANPSAHRFLADSLLTQPRRDIARVSELLQSQLLQPIGLNPLQPQLGEDKLFVLRNSGPATAGYNEYNQLFSRNRMSLQLEGLVGNRGTQGDQIVLAGVRDNVSWSVGQFDYRTNRFADDNDVRRGVMNGFIQVGIAPGTTVQAEYRQSRSDRGDTIAAFDPANALIQRTRNENSLLRLGVRHDFAPGSTLLISAISQRLDTTTAIPSFDFFLRDVLRGRTVEGQYLLTGSRFTLVSGISHSWADVESTGTFFDPLNRNQSFTNAHAYGSWVLVPGRLQVFGGLSADAVHEVDFDVNRVSPKVALAYTVVPGTTLRAARFRVTKRQLVNNQTLEPTQLAGFNQFFDDVNGVRAVNNAFAIDHKFSAAAFAGVEFHNRALRVPISLVQFGGGVPEFDWRESTHRAYAYWAARPWMALSAEVYRDHLLRPTDLPDPDQNHDLKTIRAPLAVSFYNPGGANGLSVRVIGTYVRQRALLQTFVGDLVEQTNDFWIADAVLSYRLPSRRGLIAIEARNLFDRKVRFQDIDAGNPRIAVSRLIFARLVLAF